MKRVLTTLLALTIAATAYGGIGLGFKRNDLLPQGITSDGTTITIAKNLTLGSTAAGANLTVQPGYSVDLLIANPISGWGVVTGWTNATGTHAATNTGSLVANFNVVSGTSYELNYTITQTTAGGGITPSCGGFTMPNVQAAGSYTYNFRATATTALTFAVPSGTWQGAITACTLTTPSNGNVTAFGLTLSAPLLLAMGSATYPTTGYKTDPLTGMYLSISSTGASTNNFSVTGTRLFAINSSGVFVVPTTAYIGWRAGGTFLYSDASNQLDMRNSTVAQRLNVFNTYTSATNNIYGSFDANATALTIGTWKGSVNTAVSDLPVRFVTGGVERASIGVTGNGIRIPLVSDATIQYGMIVMADAGTDGRFDVCTNASTLAIGILSGLGATAQGTTSDVAIAGRHFIAPAEDGAPVVRADYAEINATTSGYATFSSTIPAAGKAVGRSMYAEALYTINVTTGVNTGTETITLSSAPGWAVAEPVIYWDSGGTAIGGLVSGNVYWIASITTTAVTLSATRGGAVVDLTDSGTDNTQYLQRLPLCMIHFN